MILLFTSVAQKPVVNSTVAKTFVQSTRSRTRRQIRKFVDERLADDTWRKPHDDPWGAKGFSVLCKLLKPAWRALFPRAANFNNRHSAIKRLFRTRNKIYCSASWQGSMKWKIATPPKMKTS